MKKFLTLIAITIMGLSLVSCNDAPPSAEIEWDGQENIIVEEIIVEEIEVVTI